MLISGFLSQLWDQGKQSNHQTLCMGYAWFSHDEKDKLLVSQLHVSWEAKMLYVCITFWKQIKVLFLNADVLQSQLERAVLWLVCWISLNIWVTKGIALVELPSPSPHCHKPLHSSDKELQEKQAARLSLSCKHTHHFPKQSAASIHSSIWALHWNTDG